MADQSQVVVVKCTVEVEDGMVALRAEIVAEAEAEVVTRLQPQQILSCKPVCAQEMVA
jgi:hypothetical protein